MNDHALSSGFLDTLQRETFEYFVHEANPLNGLIADKTQAGSPASIAAVGFALSSYPVGVERGFMRRADAIARTLATLRFFSASDQSTDVDATGYKGFYYHFLDMVTGRRVWKCELSTIDSAILVAGMLTAGAYFSGEDEDEREIRAMADALYLRADWHWAQNGGVTVTHGWKPESGFLRYRWQGYSEAMIVYLLGLARRPILCLAKAGRDGPPRTIGEHSTVMSLSTRGRSSSTNSRTSGSTFEEFRMPTCATGASTISRTVAARPMSISNMRLPIQLVYEAYGENSWGLTASDGPGPATYTIKGKKRRFFGYEARGAPDGPDDGSIAPWAVAASLPFAPEIVQPALTHFETLKLRQNNAYGFKATFNATMADRSGPSQLWISPFHFAINQGPILLMLENYRTNLIWNSAASMPLSCRRASPRGLFRGVARSRRARIETQPSLARHLSSR